MSNLKKRVQRRLLEMNLLKNNKITQADTEKIKELVARHDKLHVGCGEIKIDGFVNIDFRHTIATDISGDCTDLSFFKEGSFSKIYSHAFFEHLYKKDRVTNLKSCHSILKNDGYVMYVGFPDFRMVARYYLEGATGAVHGKFDLENVYRYTHGAPEGVSWWLEQLHKSLFDKEEVEMLLQEAGFRHYVIFNYSFMQEKMNLNLGFIACKNKPAADIKDKQWILNAIGECTDVIDADSLTILN